MLSQIYFKFSRTEIFRKYFINFDWTVAEFIDKMNSTIQIEFGYDKVEFVRTMQGNDEVPAEDADAVVRTSSTLREKFAADIARKSLAFYIRIVPSVGGASSSQEVQHECSVCYSRERELMSFFRCSHVMCETCRISCVTHGLNRCPECRSN
jgi:hypothetical protein